MVICKSMKYELVTAVDHDFALEAVIAQWKDWEAEVTRLCKASIID